MATASDFGLVTTTIVPVWTCFLIEVFPKEASPRKPVPRGPDRVTIYPMLSLAAFAAGLEQY
jgi:hypothetical protein